MAENVSAQWHGRERRKGPRLRQLTDHADEPRVEVRLARAQLWERFKALAYTLQREHTNDTSCYIGINDERPQPCVLFRVERRRPASMEAVAMTASPEVQGDEHLVFRVYTVTVVDGAASITPAELLNVIYDARCRRFVIETVPPIEEPQMAEFFLARVRGLLDHLALHR